ncbi:BTAD domain-containing putative transcriptional regulator [Nocardia seriolae]|uniref:BTAD domain-containing putative transcriptional regulator n=1 Tax=Nocardia seriolae TaxID=37332 RepID=UPI000EF1FC76|nr:BTAD domain-containing putative transcriptional regulator [Nocardia seriolae]RLP29660.1 hypothetical protein D6158_22850 [Nocardia seriolae]WKY49960.1 BTAD domain-containing putative transcriptional regulator [Nocardia seriolae]
MVRIRVLGALTAADERGELDLGGPTQRGVLARLLVARREVVPVDRLIDDLWRGEPPPPRALGALQAYVSNLRRSLEPQRAPRTPATVLISRTPGYALRIATEEVDAWLFAAELDAAGRQDDPRERRRTLERALAAWRGPAYAAFAAEPWATAEAARLEELRLGAREKLVAALLELDEPAHAAAEAEMLCSEHPLWEETWRLTALARYRSGRQADALGTLRQARAVLADELGIDPGPALTRLKSDILAQRIPLRENAITIAARPSAPGSVPSAEPGPGLFGRAAELAALHEAAAGVGARVAIVAGEAGSGKSALLQQFGTALRAAGHRVVIGRCPEDDAAPPAWPWVEILRALAREHDPGDFAPALTPLLDDDIGSAEDSDSPDTDRAHGRFLLHRAVCGYLTAVAADRPMTILLDDAHRGDAETAALLTAVATQVPGLVVLGYRPDEAPPPLTGALATLVTAGRARIRLRGLDIEDSGRLIAALTGGAAAAAVVRTLHERTGGNPFYLSEVARLLRSEGELVATSEVPEGVRDVLRRRLSRLPETGVALLRLAAVIGREFDVAVLVHAAEVSEYDVLDAVEAGVLAGLVDEIGGDADDRAAAAAAEAEALARALGDDALLAPALQARASLYDSPDRGPLGAELIEVGRRTGRRDHLLLGHTIALQAAAFSADIATAREHLDAATGLADRYQWRQAQVASAMAAGLLALATGDPDLAERHYRRADELITGAGILNAEGVGAMALFAVRLHQGRIAELAGLISTFAASAVPTTVDAMVDFQVLALLAVGDRTVAAQVRRRAKPIRDKLFRSLFLTLRGMGVAALGTPEEAAASYHELLPFRDRLAGADTGSYAVGPVDTVLGDLAARHGAAAQAAEHYRAALRLARRCGNPTWIAAAAGRLES